MTIAAARAAPINERVTVRGVVTLASGTIEDESAVVQDATGAILLRLGEEAGQLVRGELIEVAGVRSTKSGMESLRVSVPPRRIGAAPDPAPRALRTGDAGEGAEAEVVVVRGTLVANARRASSGTVSFEIDDGSGPLRVVLGASLQAADDHLGGGSWVQVTGVLGQETTGAEPTLGYRVWPRDPHEVRVLAAVADPSDASTEAGAVDAGARFGGPDCDRRPRTRSPRSASGRSADLRVGATLVTGAWEELDVAGLLWDGERLVGIAATSGELLERAIESRGPPISLELGNLVAADSHARLGVAIVTLGQRPRMSSSTRGRREAPLSRMPARGAPAAWVSIVGHLSVADGRRAILPSAVSRWWSSSCAVGVRAPFTGVASVRRDCAARRGAHHRAVRRHRSGTRAQPVTRRVADEANGSPRWHRRLPHPTSTPARAALDRGRAAGAGVAILLSVALVGVASGERRAAGTNEAAEPQEGDDAPRLTLGTLR